MTNDSIFSTRDIYLAATLVSLKFYMTGTDFVIEGSKNLPIGFFKFEDSPSLQDARSKYIQGLLSVEPKLFVTNLKSLKSEISNANQNPHNNLGRNQGRGNFN